MQDLIRRYGTGLTLIMCLLVAFWLLMLVIVPNITLFEQSFRPYLPVAEVGGPRDTYSLGNYTKVFEGQINTSLFGFEFEFPVRVRTFLLTIWYSMMVAGLCLLLAYPLAFYMAKIVNPRSLPTLIPELQPWTLETRSTRHLTRTAPTIRARTWTPMPYSRVRLPGAATPSTSSSC